MPRLSPVRLLAITIIGFALTLVSNTLEPAVLGRKVLELVPDNRNTALGFTTFASLIVAIVVQPVVGALSDRTRTRWGRRLPYLAGGTIMVIVCLYLIAFARNFALVVLGMLLISFSSNTVQGPWQALIPDQAPEGQRGQAAGLKGMFDILALVIGRLVAGQLVARYPEWGNSAVTAAVSVPAVVFLLALAFTAWGAREGPGAADQAPRRSVRDALAGAFWIDFRAHPAFVWWFLNRLLFWAAFIALNTFLLFFLMDVVLLPEADAQRYVGTLSTVLGAALALVTLPTGWLADRIGRKPLVIAAGIVAATGVAVVLAVRELPVILVGGAVVGVGAGIFVSSSWALIADIVPREEAARYMGVANIATAGGSALARLLGGALIDSLNRAFQSTSVGYYVLYVIALLFFLGGAAAMLPLPAHRPARDNG